MRLILLCSSYQSILWLCTLVKQKYEFINVQMYVHKKSTNISSRKMYQHTKVGLSTRDVGEVRKAKEEGNLHETLLDRRMKMKSDKYC